MTTCVENERAHGLTPQQAKAAEELGYQYRPDGGRRVAQFFKQFLRHTKGSFAGKPFTLLPWQRQHIIDPAYGWVHRETGHRLINRIYCNVAKKNGKTTLGAGLGLFHLVGDGEQGAEVYSAAVDREQASLAHGEAVRMVERSPVLRDYCRMNRTTKTINFPETQSYYKALSSDVEAKEGLNISAAVLDELHVWPGHDLWNTLRYGTAFRDQPMILVITTAGVVHSEGLGWTQHQYAMDVIAGKVNDPHTLVYIAAADPSDDWGHPATWEKANPSWGVTVRREEMASAWQEAAQVPRLESTFRRYRLNQWTEKLDYWIRARDWAALKSDAEPGPGWSCYGGLDLAAVDDFNSLCLVWKKADQYIARWWFWMPGDCAPDKAKLHRAPLLDWHNQGWLELTKGNTADYEYMTAEVLGLCKKHKVQELAFDPWGAKQMAQQLQGKGINVIQFNQSALNYNEPCSNLERLITSKSLAHDGNPIAQWNIENTVLWSNTEGHCRPSKKLSRKKIDGAVALLMALGRAMLSQQGSPYADRGVLTI